MNAASLKAAVLGSADGTTSIAGVIAGAAATGTGHAGIAKIALGGALAATVSMAGAEMLSESKTDWGAVCAMGLGTLLGSGLPALPLFALRGLSAWLAVLAVGVVLACAVGEVRARANHGRRRRTYAQTLAVLAVGGAVGYGAGLF